MAAGQWQRSLCPLCPTDSWACFTLCPPGGSRWPRLPAPGRRTRPVKKNPDIYLKTNTDFTVLVYFYLILAFPWHFPKPGKVHWRTGDGSGEAEGEGEGMWVKGSWDRDTGQENEVLDGGERPDCSSIVWLLK